MSSSATSSDRPPHLIMPLSPLSIAPITSGHSDVEDLESPSQIRRAHSKLNPIAVDKLRGENMMVDTLNKLCFQPQDLPIDDPIVGRDSGGDQHGRCGRDDLLKRTTSRSGRDQQRFATDARTGQLLRLTTGCVPILKNGKVLLISSSRKEEWILPKGGWESDEALQISAQRETFEEAGILGSLGQQLTQVDYETRKAKKRRLEREMWIKKQDICALTNNGTGLSLKTSSSGASDGNSKVFSSNDDQQIRKELLGEKRNTQEAKVAISPVSNASSVPLPKTSVISTSKPLEASIQSNPCEDASSTTSSDASQSCTHVRMHMFPIYVLEVKEKWPESGRARKVVDIDTAIEIMASRPEFLQVLLEIKEKRLHLINGVETSTRTR